MTGPERPDWVPTDLYPFEDRWAEIDGNLVHYVDAAIADWWATQAPTPGNAPRAKVPKPPSKRKPPARKGTRDLPTPT